ncbi:MAG: DUF1844 domain-containing protein [Candidatus Omnitrophica bacterium]|nr:DUF1844 domain-containing protein [Candidatus Omnitrophota bacterium]MBU1995743.1 DUF1844 domain-containing protein [Candidatus Omnitrophota bacterium]MBU4333092.1 DUF1844 domain-containing protein [Candidatus Omnitrophota bacterium]
MEKDKYVDESWKRSAEEEKEKLDTQNRHADLEQCTSEGNCSCSGSDHNGDESAQAPIEINFINYVTSLGFQSMIFLGEIPNPITGETENNIDQAKFLIDTLAMLKDKTKGNLSKQEEELLNSSVYELQMKYVEIIQKDKLGI